MPATSFLIPFNRAVISNIAVRDRLFSSFGTTTFGDIAQKFCQTLHLLDLICMAPTNEMQNKLKVYFQRHRINEKFPYKFASLEINRDVKCRPEVA